MTPSVFQTPSKLLPPPDKTQNYLLEHYQHQGNHSWHQKQHPTTLKVSGPKTSSPNIWCWSSVRLLPVCQETQKPHRWALLWLTKTVCKRPEQTVRAITTALPPFIHLGDPRASPPRLSAGLPQLMRVCIGKASSSVSDNQNRTEGKLAVSFLSSITGNPSPPDCYPQIKLILI